MRVSSASLVKVSGPGLQDGLIAQFQPKFSVDLSEAGKGEIKMEIGGPKGAFNIETKKEGKTLRCSYHVREPGQYIINIYWCGDHVPDSPYHVFIWRTDDELKRYRLIRQQVGQANRSPPRGRAGSNVT